MKKLFLTVLVLLAAMGAICAVAETSIVDSGTCGTSVTWQLDSDGLLTISGTGEMSSYSYFTTAPWKTYYNEIKSVTVESGVTSIGHDAFYCCSSLTSVTIPEGVTSIGSCAFEGCSALTSITIPEGVTSIEDFTFSSCSSLTIITIPDGVTSIGISAFSHCRKLTSIKIPDSVASIDSSTFSDCSSLTVYCYKYSYAQNWSADYNLSYVLLDTIDETVPVSMSLPDSIEIGAGYDYQFNPVFFPDKAYNCVWSSSDEQVATVSSTGLVTYSGLGQAVITLTIGDKAVNTTVNCVVLCDSLSLPKDEVWIIAAGPTYQIVPVLSPANMNESIYYVSDNTTIATVYSTGQLMAKTEGDVTITVSTSVTRKTASMTIHLCYPPQSLSFEETTASVTINKTLPLHVNVTTYNGSYVNKLVTFESSDTSIATVDEDGVVSGISLGTATITAIGDGITTSCEVSVNECVHESETVVAIAPTCLENGYTAGTRCTLCGKYLTGHNVIPPVGHTEVADEEILPACTIEGYTAGIRCSVCNTILSGHEPIPATGHTEVSDSAIPATCTTDGKTAGTHCSVCDAILSGNEVIPATGHTVVTDKAIPATCTTDGKTAGTHCSVCDAILSGNEVIPATGHTVVADAYIAPTLTSIGRTAGTHCEVCGEILSGNETIPMLTDAPVIAIPKAVIAIAAETYIGSGVEVVILPDSCTAIGSRAFADCTSLKLIVIPASVTAIAADAFDGSSAVVIVTYPGSYAQQYAAENGIDYLTKVQ